MEGIYLCQPLPAWEVEVPVLCSPTTGVAHVMGQDQTLSVAQLSVELGQGRWQAEFALLIPVVYIVIAIAC